MTNCPDPQSLGGPTAAAAYQVPKPVVQKRMGNRPGRADATSGIMNTNSEQAVTSFSIPLLAQLLPAVAAGKPRRRHYSLRLRGHIPAPIEGPRGVCNFGDMRCRWRSFPSPLAKHPQKSRGGLSYRFHRLLRLFAHAAKHAARSFVSVPKSIGVVRNVGG